MPAITVVGIGNSLLTDDGAGIHALRRIEAATDDPDVRCLDAGTVGLAIMDRLCGLDGLVAIDAMKNGHGPGTVTVLEAGEMDAFLRNRRGSAHEVGLSDLLDGLRLCGQLPARRALVGIEPAEIGWGTGPSPPVDAAMPGVVAAVRELVRRWRDELSQAGVA